MTEQQQFDWNRLDEILEGIAWSLSEEKHRLAKLQSDANELDWQMVILELEITPEDGWPGANADKREISKLRAFLSNEKMTTFRSDKFKLDREIDRSKATIDGLQDQRRSIEWIITRRMIDVLGKRPYGAPGRQMTTTLTVDKAKGEVLEEVDEDDIPF